MPNELMKTLTIGANTYDLPQKTSDLTNDSGFITNETDPVFMASAAHGITSTDITNWNSKSDFSGDYNDLSNKPTIPAAVTESTVAGWGFTKNTGTYSKPSGGIPKTDLASAVQTSLGKADTALQSYTESDPIFTASAAHGIASTDITNWNNKISEPASEGTNGQVLMTNGSGTRTWGSVSTADEKVKLTSQSTSGNYPLIFGPTSITSNSTYQGYYNTGITINPSTKAVTATTFVGALTGTASGNLTSSSTLDASKLSGAIPSAVTATTQTSTDNSTKIATTAFVKTAIDNLPEPMVFKGSLGTGGTITSLPTASTSNTGYTYKVITAGTYASQSAKIGDTFISDGSAWILIPSGDEPSGTVTSITLKATSPISIDSTGAITTSGTRTLSHADSGVTAGTYKSVTVDSKGHVTAGSNPSETDPVFTASAAHGISSSDITNWNGKTSNTGTVTSVRVQATSPVTSSVNTAQSSTLNTTIALADGYGDTKNPYASKTKNYVLAAPSNANGVPGFRTLVANDIPSLTVSKISDFPTIPTKTSELTNDSGFLTSFTETDPTVPSWAKASTKPSYTASEVGAAASSHTHGNITNSGDITTNATIANGDRLVINDESASKVINSSITFGTSTSQYLANNGTWQSVPTVPTKLSAFTDDLGSSPTHTHSQYLTSYTETDPTVPSWAKASSKPTYTKSEVGLGNVDNVKQYSASNPPPYPVTSVNGNTGAVTVSVPTKVSQLTNDSNYYSEPTYGIGTADPITRPLVETVRANRLAFLPASQIIIEQTTDGGTTWTDAGISDANKAGLFAGTRPSIYLPLLNNARSTNCGLRVTITAMRYNVPSGTAETAKYNYWNSTYVASQERYCSIDKFWFWLGANGDRQRIKVESATGANPNNWRTKFDTDFGANGWSGSDWVKTSYGAFGGGTNQTGNEWNWRITFFSRMADGASAFTQTSKQAIYQIMAYGENVWGSSNNLMKTDRLYAYDVNQNATFPAKVTATGGFVGSISDVATQGSATNSTARHIWFSDSSTETKRAHNDNFKYTPSTNTITANLSGSATLTGTPTAPTASAGTNNTQIATTAFVKTAIDNAGLWEQGVDSNNQPVPGAIKAKDFVNSSDVTKTNSAPWTGVFVAGGGNTATGSYAVIAGSDNTANGSSTVFGYNNTAAGGGGSTLLGNSNQATSGTWGFATGVGNTISHNNTVAMGWQNTASNYNAVAMGYINTASGHSSVAMGNNNTASGHSSFAVGYQNTASAAAAYAEGRETVASGNYSHSAGKLTIANSKSQTVFGEYNAEDPGFTAANARGSYIEIVGNGADEQNRSNARTLDWSGNEWVAGLVSVGSSSTPPTPTADNHLTTKKYVDDIVGNIETLLASI